MTVASESGSDPGPPRHRRQPVILKPAVKPSRRLAESAGATAAECAAICCCCPCGLVNLLVLAVVKLPAGLCRRAVRRRLKRRGKKKAPALLAPRAGAADDGEDGAAGTRRAVVAMAAAAPAAEIAAMEREMWAKFYGTGFWRSPSQREDVFQERDGESTN